MKYRVALFIASVLVVVLAANATEVIGRPVTISAAAIGYGGNYEEKMATAIEHVHAAGKLGVDILCLPEVFNGGEAEPVPGPTTNIMAALAQEYGMYII